MPSQSGITARAIMKLWEEHEKSFKEPSNAMIRDSAFSTAARNLDAELGKEVSEYTEQHKEGLISTAELIVKITDLY